MTQSVIIFVNSSIIYSNLVRIMIYNTLRQAIIKIFNSRIHFGRKIIAHEQKVCVSIFRGNALPCVSFSAARAQTFAEMTNIGLPDPAGCHNHNPGSLQTGTHEDGRTISPEIRDQIIEYIGKLEEVVGKKFDDKENPLLVFGSFQSARGFDRRVKDVDTILRSVLQR